MYNWSIAYVCASIVAVGAHRIKSPRTALPEVGRRALRPSGVGNPLFTPRTRRPLYFCQIADRPFGLSIVPESVHALADQ